MIFNQYQVIVSFGKRAIFFKSKNTKYDNAISSKNNKIINMITGPFINQHDVDVISKKEISIFNNNLYYYKGPRVDGGNLHFDGIHELKNAEVIIYDFEKKILERNLKIQ